MADPHLPLPNQTHPKKRLDRACDAMRLKHDSYRIDYTFAPGQLSAHETRPRSSRPPPRHTERAHARHLARTPAYNLDNPQQQDDHAMIDTEGQYLDVLQNIEAAVVSVYRDHPELLDYEVEKALNALATAYQAEQHGRARQPAALAPPAQQVYAAVHAMCEWRLGRETLPSADGSPDPRPEPLPLEVVIACLKSIRKSVQNWTRREGRQGYLRFVSEYV